MVLLCLSLLSAGPAAAQTPSEPTTTTAPTTGRGLDFLGLLHPDARHRRKARKAVVASFTVADVPMALEVLRFQPDRDLVVVLWAWLDENTGERFARSHDRAFQWLWAQEYTPHADYPMFKAAIYQVVDRRFSAYFEHADDPRIRLDEIRWGGVKQNGIPPLRQPWMEPAADATWLSGSDVVFGVVVGDDVRAYPKRVLAWHEMFVDTVGGVEVVGVYCTLCGSMIVYGTTVDGVAHRMGTSGFLYRSNKLMFDEATQSLWSTLGGTPVVGPLADDGITLPMWPVVTTTWGAWKAQHPDTQVLSRDTGYARDYGEGVAYRDYFASDALMFTVPETDARLKNKDEVLALRVGGEPVALSAAWLLEHPVHHEALGGVRVVVLTDPWGANRVYEAGERTFTSIDPAAQVTDAQGQTWAVTEAALVAGDERLLRVPAHRAFWFGWRAAYPDTRLVR